MAAGSREGLLRHDDVEVLRRDFHLLLVLARAPHDLRDLLVREPLAELLADLHHVLDHDRALAVMVEELEDLVDLFLGVLLVLPLLPGHQVQELLEVEGGVAVLVELGQHREYRVVLALVAKGLHRRLQLFQVDLPRLVRVKEVEGLLDLFYLVLLQAGPLVLARLEVLVLGLHGVHRGAASTPCLRRTGAQSGRPPVGSRGKGRT
mmetsp:Transcript_1858/g.5458  ORF Transcript_1858/g.5458 Transcript_1858/m.5458 type:complete len:206 (-) Transcript_1858:51-668(-)